MERRLRKEAAERRAREEVEQALGSSFGQRPVAASHKRQDDAEDDVVLQKYQAEEKMVCHWGLADSQSG